MGRARIVAAHNQGPLRHDAGIHAGAHAASLRVVGKRISGTATYSKSECCDDDFLKPASELSAQQLIIYYDAVHATTHP